VTAASPRWRWALLLVACATVAAIAAAPAAEVAPEQLAVPATTAAVSDSTDLEPPDRAAVPTTTEATEVATASTPVPEERRPLSAEGIRAEVAPSVAYVLTLQGAGSGVVISDELLLTNAHVVWPANTVSLVFLSGAVYTGSVLAVDPFVDLALVDIGGLTRKPPPLELGSLRSVAVDDPMWVVGYPAPREFTPEVTIDSGAVLGLSDWEFTGATWVTIAAPAIGGQSGGALVDEYGRLVGVTTFGSSSSLTSVGVDGLQDWINATLASDLVRGLPSRHVPHGGARRNLPVDLAGPWDQQIWLGWLPASSEETIRAAGGPIDLAATDIEGGVVASAEGDLGFFAGGLLPVFVVADAPRATESELDASLPLVPYPDPDHGKALARHGTTPGIFDLGGDRDFFYLDLVAGEPASVTVESAARTSLRVFDPSGSVIAADDDDSGFIADNAAVEFTAAVSGRYVVSLQSSRSSLSGYAVVTD
jgi:S1-C subfamily serine protease